MQLQQGRLQGGAVGGRGKAEEEEEEEGKGRRRREMKKEGKRSSIDSFLGMLVLAMADGVVVVKYGWYVSITLVILMHWCV